MKYIAELILSIKNGYLPHLANEIYKRGCEIKTLKSTENQGDAVIFKIDLVYSRKEQIKGIIEKIEKHSDNFTILDFKRSLEDSIINGLIDITGKMPIETLDDYEMKVMGAAGLTLEKIDEGADALNFIGISNNVALINGIKSRSDIDRDNLLKRYVLSEKDSLVIKHFSGINAFPLIVRYEHIEDFIKSVRSIENTFSVIRIDYIEHVDDFSVLKDFYQHLSIPVLIKSYDEIPIYLLTSIIKLSKKNKLEIGDTNVGFIGIDVSGIRLAGLLSKTGFQKILGYDRSERHMLSFENEGGLATTPENIFSNSDVIVLYKDHFTIDDFYKIRPGQIIISLINDDDIDKDFIKKKGVKEYLNDQQMDISFLFPGILKGLIGTKISCLDDNKIIQISRNLMELTPEGKIFPGIFSDVHEKIRDIIKSFQIL